MIRTRGRTYRASRIWLPVLFSALVGGLAIAWAPDATTPVLPLGSLAPEFSLTDSTGAKRSLSEFRGKKHVALVFYTALFRAGG